MFDFKNSSKTELAIKFKKIAKNTGAPQFGTKKELNFLPEVLMNQEQVLALTSGMKDAKTWLIALTDKRIIFLDKGMFGGLKQHFIPLEKVSTISGSTGLLLGSIEISTGSSAEKIENVDKKCIPIFTQKVTEQLEVLKSGGQPAPQNSSPTIEDPYEKLIKLGELKEKGLLTEEEFADQKQKILSAS